MIDVDDGTAVDDFVVGRREEQPGDRPAHEGLMISGGVGMTHRNFGSQGFQIICLQVR
jgi:hypothetical protein